MKLYVMRHGPAEDRGHGVAEFDRQLTPKGRDQTAAAARGLARLGLNASQIISSPLLRCLETAELAAAALASGQPPEPVDALAAGASPGAILQAIRYRPDGLLLVGHDPDLSQLVSYLLSSEPAPFIDFSKGGVVALESNGAPQAGSCRLLWYLRRKQLAQLGG
ncbi:MAG TPA: histidine phosphatase family protein [Chloroflexota bacterium]|nr:histidine phosphatase family protein [Chloroflexota bacterium]